MMWISTCSSCAKIPSSLVAIDEPAIGLFGLPILFNLNREMEKILQILNGFPFPGTDLPRFKVSFSKDKLLVFARGYL